MSFPSAALPYSASVQFYGSTLQIPLLNPNTLTITQQEYAHDTAVMQFWGGDVEDAALASGTPMALSFGSLGGTRSFYGYVNHATRTNTASSLARTLTDRNAVTVTCVGASWPMKAVGTQGWSSVTVSQIAEGIASEFHFSTQVAPDKTLWPSRQMSGNTYWQFCVGLAQLIGYTFYVSGTQLVCKPRNTNPAALPTVTAIYDYKTNPAGIISFIPTLGANSPSGGQLATRQLAGVNPRTTQLVFSQVSGSPSPTSLGGVVNSPPFTQVHHATINSQQEANAVTNGAGALNQLYLTATAQVSGNAMISQGSLVYIQNANGSQNGLWFVTKAVHSLTPTSFVTDLTLGRDSLGGAPSLSILPQIQVPAATTLRNQVWVAA